MTCTWLIDRAGNPCGLPSIVTIGETELCKSHWEFSLSDRDQGWLDDDSAPVITWPGAW